MDLVAVGSFVIHFDINFPAVFLKKIKLTGCSAKMNKILFAYSLLGQFLNAMHPTDPYWDPIENNIKVMTWNVNTDKRCENGFAAASHSAWSFSNRIARVSKVIANAQADILCLQELDRNNIDAVRSLLCEMGYAVVAVPYCADPEYFTYCTAFKASRFGFITSKMRYMNIDTRNPTFRPDNLHLYSVEDRRAFNANYNFGEERERSVLQVALCDLLTNKTIVVHNNHFGMRPNYRLRSSIMLVEFIKEFTDELGSEPDVTLVMGDFNAFPDQYQSAIQISKIKDDANLEDLAAHGISYSTGSNESEELASVLSSFCFNPYDFGLLWSRPGANASIGQVMFHINHIDSPDEKFETINNFFFDNMTSVLGGKLDFIFAKGHKRVLKYTIMLNQGLDEENLTLDVFQDPDSLYEFVKSFTEEGIPAFPSDHLPNCVELMI